MTSFGLIALLMGVGLAGCGNEAPCSPALSAPTRGASDIAASRPSTPRTAYDMLRQALLRGMDHPDTVVDWAYVIAIVRASDQLDGVGARGFTTHGPILWTDETQAIGQRLLRALPMKRGAALIPSLHSAGRLGFGKGVAFRDAVMRAWPQSSNATRITWLSSYWPALRDERLLPLLRAELKTPPQRATQWHSAYLPTVALARLVEMRPEEARPIILSDIGRDQPLYGWLALAALPDRHLDAVEAHFRKPIRKLSHWSFDWGKNGPLAERYGGAQALARALAMLDLPAHQHNTHLLRIVMSQDRPETFRRMAKALATRDPKAPDKHRLVLRDVLAANWIGRASYWGPDAREFVLRYQSDRDEEVAKQVTSLLSAASNE